MLRIYLSDFHGVHAKRALLVQEGSGVLQGLCGVGRHHGLLLRGSGLDEPDNDLGLFIAGNLPLGQELSDFPLYKDESPLRW